MRLRLVPLDQERGLDSVWSGLAACAKPLPTFDFKTVTAISSCNGSCQGRLFTRGRGGGGRGMVLARLVGKSGAEMLSKSLAGDALLLPLSATVRKTA